MRNAKIYVDLNYLEYILKLYEDDTNSKDVIAKLINKISKEGFNILEVDSIGDYESRTTRDNKTQSNLYNMNVTTKFSPRNSDDGNSISLISEIFNDIYLNENIDTYIILTKTKNIVPLINTLKKKNKKFILSDLKKKFPENMVFPKESTLPIEEYINLKKGKFSKEEYVNSISLILKDIDESKITSKERGETERIHNFLINSPFYKDFSKNGIPENAVSLGGFINHYCFTFDLSRDYMKNNLYIAQKLGYIEVYFEDEKERLCIKDILKKN